jgi:glycosyltransferase involved in cell wall biosynthesis
VLECAQRAQRRKLPIHLTLIGHSTDDGALGEAGVRVSGPYHDADLPNLIGSWNGDVIWHPAQCPETFSYTLGASMNSGLPLVVPDIGAFRERVSGRASTWVKPWDTTADEWLDFFLKQREHAELGDELVQLPRPAYAENFYDSDYLYWLKD